MCKACGSRKQSKFKSEVCIHVVENFLQEPNCPPILAYPELTVCLNCGFVEFPLTNGELDLLRETGNPTQNQGRLSQRGPEARIYLAFFLSAC